MQYIVPDVENKVVYFMLSKCSATGKECASCGKTGHFANMCRTTGNRKSINCMPEVTQSSEECINDFCFKVNSIE